MRLSELLTIGVELIPGLASVSRKAQKKPRIDTGHTKDNKRKKGELSIGNQLVI
jgi:hypothetical protein